MSKKIVKRIGANKSISTISRVCKATNGIRDILTQFDNEILLDSGSSHHTKRQSTSDEITMIDDIFNFAPFTNSGPRCYEHFSEIKRAPQRYLNVTEFAKWVELRKKEWSVTEVFDEE